MAFGETLDNGQPEAGPGGLGGEEGFQQTFGNRRVYTHTAVLHRDLDEAIALGFGHPDQAPVGHGLIGVGDEVRHHLDQLGPVSLQVDSEALYGHLDSRWWRSRFKDFGDHSTKIEGDDDGLALAHVRGEVLAQRRCPVGLPLRPIEVAIEFGASWSVSPLRARNNKLTTAPSGLRSSWPITVAISPTAESRSLRTRDAWAAISSSVRSAATPSA